MKHFRIHLMITFNFNFRKRFHTRLEVEFVIHDNLSDFIKL